MATHDETQQDENTALSTALSAAYDAVEAGDTAPAGETLEIDEAAAAAPAAAAAADDAGEADPAAQPEAAGESAEAKPEGEKAAAELASAEQAAEGAETTTAPEDAAPSSWRREVAEKWKDTPAEVRAEVIRREADYHKGIEQYKSAAQVAQAFEKVIAPYAATIQAGGVDAFTAVNTLLRADHILRYSDPATKAQYFAQIAGEYGIDLTSVQQAPPVDPAMAALQRQNQQLQRFQQEVTQRDAQTVQTEIDAFASDPKNAHFQEVRDDMSVLLQSGRATSLQDAYDKAVWMRPDIRKSLVEQQRTEAEKTATAQARDKRAKAAAVGVKGSALTKGGINNPNASLRDTIAAAMAGDA